jgi:hypothetical protein
MQANSVRNPRSNYLSWLSAMPVALIVGLSLAACTSNVPTPTPTTTTMNPTDPSCRVNTCSSLGKNCGVISDGCGNELRCGTCAGSGNDCINNVCQRACTSNSECPSGSSCLAGSCTDKCSSASDCPSGQTCTNGSCTANAAQYCHYDSDCRSNERCLNNACIGTGTSSSNQACAYDSQCLNGEHCNNGLCQNVGGRTCRYNTDCYTNETCSNGYCYQQNGNTSCRNDYDCGSGATCSYGVCVGGYNNGGYNGGVRSQCVTTGISLPLPFGSVNFAVENWYYDAQHPNGTRVDSCTCSPGVMHLSDSSGYHDVGCSQCIKSGDQRTCYN